MNQTIKQLPSGVYSVITNNRVEIYGTRVFTDLCVFVLVEKSQEKNTSMDKIRLLDGEEHEVKPLLKKMEDDAFYYGELNQLALSSSSLKLLVDSPKKYHYIQKYGQGESQG